MAVRPQALAGALLAAVIGSTSSAQSGDSELGLAIESAVLDQCAVSAVSGTDVFSMAAPSNFKVLKRATATDSAKMWTGRQGALQLTIDDLNWCNVRVFGPAAPAPLRAQLATALTAKGWTGGSFGTALGGEGVRDLYCKDVGTKHLFVLMSTVTATKSKQRSASAPKLPIQVTVGSQPKSCVGMSG